VCVCVCVCVCVRMHVSSFGFLISPPFDSFDVHTSSDNKVAFDNEISPNQMAAAAAEASSAMLILPHSDSVSSVYI